MSSLGQLIAGGLQNVAKGKQGCKIEELFATSLKLVELLSKIHNIRPEEASEVVHSTLSKILSDTEGVYHHQNPLLPFAEILALFIELFTPYFVEVSSLEDQDDKVFYQIDEKNNEFYFAFFGDHFEFAFGDYNNCQSFLWSAIFPVSEVQREPEPEPQHESGSVGVVPKLRELGASEDLIGAWEIGRAHV